MSLTGRVCGKCGAPGREFEAFGDVGDDIGGNPVLQRRLLSQRFGELLAGADHPGDDGHGVEELGWIGNNAPSHQLCECAGKRVDIFLIEAIYFDAGIGFRGMRKVDTHLRDDPLCEVSSSLRETRVFLLTIV